MHQVNAHEAKTHLSKLIQEAVAKGSKPVVKLVALHHQKPQRQPGTAKGKMVMADDFDESLDDFRLI